jgi:hypothetical protein
MLGGAIAARPVARDGLSRLTTDLGRTRLAQAPLRAAGEDAETAWEDGGARVVRAGTAAATRP